MAFTLKNTFKPSEDGFIPGSGVHTLQKQLRYKIKTQ